MMLLRSITLAVVLIGICSTASLAQPTPRKLASFSRPAGDNFRISGAREVELSDDGKTLLVAFYGSRAQLFDLESQEKISEAFRTGGDGEIGFVNAEMAYTADWESLRLWDTKTGEAIGGPIPHELREDTIISPAISPNGNLIATRDTMNSFQIWDTTNRKTIASFTGYKAEVNSLRFSADGHYLLAKIGNKLLVIDPEMGHKVAGPFVTSFRYSMLKGAPVLVTTERKGDETDHLVFRSMAKEGWPEIDRIHLPGKFTRLIELAEGKLLIQSQQADYTPNLFTTSLADLQNHEVITSQADRAFNLLVTSNQKYWVCNNINNVACHTFTQEEPIWTLAYRQAGYDQRLRLLNDQLLLIHGKSGEDSRKLSCHNLLDGSKIWEQDDVRKVVVKDGKLFLCDQGGVHIWIVE